MGEFKGTPGPWIKEVRKSKIMAIIPDKKYSPRVMETLLITGTIHDDDCGNSVCCCVSEHANDQLISVAPEMFEMIVDHRKRISELLAIMEGQCSMWSHHRQLFNDLTNESEELINKATGNL
jgi:hypothetical protein